MSFVFPPPRSGGEQYDEEGYRAGSDRPGFLFPPPQNTHENTPFEVAEQVGSRVTDLTRAQAKDTKTTDQARADAENAIAQNMSSSLEMLDEIQRFGGAYNGSYAYYNTTWGEETAEVVPLTHAVELAAGTSFQPPNLVWTDYADGATRPDTGAARALMARYSGQLVLNEPGLWLVFFRAGVLQGNAYTNRPADLWCYVTPNTGGYAPYLPVGQPGFTEKNSPATASLYSRHRETGALESPVLGYLKAFGRATEYVGLENAQTGGGVSLFGSFPVYLEDGGYKVSMSIQSYRKYGGASTCTVFAYKVNSESLRDSIDDLKADIAAALPGELSEMEIDSLGLDEMISGGKW